MLFFYIRHGDPIYNPDSLTPLGERQAEACAKRLALYGIDRIFASTSNRAILTATPACEMTKKELTTLDFANERYAWRDFTVERNGKKDWIFRDKETKTLFSDPEVVNLGYNWYEHPAFTDYKAGVDRIYEESYDFLKSLGYEHIRNSGKYKVINSNDERVALFAHQGFGIAFLSTILDIPYPMFGKHFDMCHTGMTVIEFAENDGYAVPKVLTLSSDSHLYREGLPTKYENRLYF